MRTADFLNTLGSLWEGDPLKATHPKDRKLQRLLAETGGMASENKLAVLNLAANYLEDGEVYLEVGAWKGTSICGAAIGNDDKTFITVDDFSLFGGSMDECLRNIARYTTGNVQLVNRSYWTLLTDPSFKPKVGVYFYDGGHEYWDHWRAIERSEPLLANEALVLIDDASWSRVRAATNAFVVSHPRFEFAARFPMQSPSGTWWNGLDVIVYRRDLLAANVLAVLASYYWGMIIYGLLGRGVRALLRPLRNAVDPARRFPQH